MEDRRAKGQIIVDRRRASRTPVRFDVLCTLEGASFEATCRNLTPHGVFVETEQVVALGACLELALCLPDAEASPAKATVEVRRPAERRDEVPGFGADFVALDEHTARRIRDLLATKRGSGHESP